MFTIRKACKKTEQNWCQLRTEDILVVFYDLDGNKFDVWSKLSPVFKEKYLYLELLHLSIGIPFFVSRRDC